MRKRRPMNRAGMLGPLWSFAADRILLAPVRFGVKRFDAVLSWIGTGSIL